MVSIFSTGNSTVDAIGQMNFTGNVIPMNWYKTILRDNGKPYLLAICILSEICYWYRPKEVRDEQTGYVVEYKKRFKEDILQKNYNQLAVQFGESKRSVKAAMDCLEELGVINRIWRNKKYKNGTAVTNILYIELKEDKLYELTFCAQNDVDSCYEDQCNEASCDEEPCEEGDDEDDEKGAENPVNKHVTKFCNTILQKNVGGPTKKCTTLLQNNVGGPTKKCTTHLQNNVGGPTEKCRTNTENTIEINTEITKEITSGVNKSIVSNHIYLDATDHGQKLMDRIESIRMSIKENIDYDDLAVIHKGSIREIDELVEIMAEALVYEKDEVVGGKLVPFSLIKARFDKVDFNVIEYILETLRNNTTKVRNVKKYLLTTIYNAPLTMENYYGLETGHDREQQRWSK